MTKAKTIESGAAQQSGIITPSKYFTQMEICSTQTPYLVISSIVADYFGVVSGPRELPPRPLSEPDVKLSPHPAPITRTFKI